MKLTTAQRDNVTIVQPTGRLDHAQATAFLEALAPHLAACSATGPALLLDFSAVDYISSVGLRALLIITRQVNAQHGRVAVAARQPAVREVFEISRFHLVLKSWDSVAEGVAALGTLQAADLPRVPGSAERDGGN